MRLIRCLDDLPTPWQGCVATIGNFDGIHLGHQAILERVKARAKELGVVSCVIIFEPQPREFFEKEQAPIRLTNIREKLELFKKQNIDVVVCLHFNQRLKELSANDFIQKILVTALKIKHLEVGDDFHFGAKRSGTFTMLVEAGLAHGFSVENAKTAMLDGERVSSTRVRDALKADDLVLAECLLGRPFQLAGKVIHGQQLARLLGWPTANVQLKRCHAPLRGVFVASCEFEGKVYYGVANIGLRPTIEGNGCSHLEIHILNFSDDIYNRYLSVTFHQKLRDEERFNSLEELKAAINNDVNNARAYWQARNKLNP